MVTRRLIRISPEERAARLAAAAKRTNKADCTVNKHDDTKGLSGGCSEMASKCEGVISGSAKSAGSRRRKRPLHHVEKTGDKRGQKRQKGMQNFIDLTDVPEKPPIINNRNNATSKYQGVYFDKAAKKWRADIRIDGKKHHVGTYDDEEEAAVDYARAVFKYRAKGQRVQKITTNLTDVSTQVPIRSNEKGQKRRRGMQKIIDLTDVPKKSPIISSNTDGTSKYHGVSFNKMRKKWEAVITIDGKKHHIGYYDDEEEAAVDYARAVFKYKAKGQRVQKTTIDLTDVPARGPIRSTKGGQKRQRGLLNFIDLTDVSEKPPIISEITGGTSKYQGVSFHKATKKWRAKITIDGKQHQIGTFDDEQEAAVDYARAVSKYGAEESKGRRLQKKYIDLTNVPEQLPIIRSNRNGSTSKYLGVSFDTAKKKWVAKIKFDGKKHHIGTYDDEEEAAVDYARAAYKYRAVNAGVKSKQYHKFIDLSDVPKQAPIVSNRNRAISKYEGISFDKTKKKKWKAEITVGGKRHYIGRYDDEEEAAVDYARAVFKYSRKG